MAQTQAKTTTRTPDLQAVPPTPPVEDDDSSLSPSNTTINIEDSGAALRWLEGLADVLAMAPDGFQSETTRRVGEIMYVIAEAGYACYEREQKRASHGA